VTKYWLGTGERIRHPVAAGFFYPESKEEIQKLLSSYGAEERGKALAVLAPHGAWELSGKAAAAAFNALKGRSGLRRMVILSMVHEPQSGAGKGKDEGGIYLSDSDSFMTALGKLPVDGDSVEELASCSTLFKIHDIPHLVDHSIEVLLPMVKYWFPHISIVPVLSDKTSASCKTALARALNVVYRNKLDETAFVISTCLSRSGEEEKARIQAENFIAILLDKSKNKGEGIFREISGGTLSCCGGFLTAALFESGLQEGLKARRLLPGLFQARSLTGDTICYNSIAFEPVSAAASPSAAAPSRAAW
jgi:AmmeMemoRadiSam system protein B